jgi:lipoprotein-releasing system permease protein
LYKLLLCWRYLLTRYLALACIVSVMLGVATLIVVNSVMSGFSTKLKDRLHGLLSDVLIEAVSLEGFADSEFMMDHIRQHPVLKEKIEAMTATMEIFAMLQFPDNGETITRPVRLIGIDPEGRSLVGGFKEHLVYQKNLDKPSFDLTPQARQRFDQLNPPLDLLAIMKTPAKPGEPPPPDPPPSTIKEPEGTIIGQAIAMFKLKEPDGTMREVKMLEPGDTVWITTVGGGGQQIKGVQDSFVVCDYFKSEMSEYDSNFVFVPLKHLQHLRTMEDRVTSIQIKLKNYAEAEDVVNILKKLFPAKFYHVTTWEDKQGALLAAISVERGLLNVLLFLIIGVAGFGILAIFTMIVAEKTRDIGILKALGASSGGIMKIFLGYGLLLGVVGACLGTVLGLVFTHNINEIEHFLTKMTGQELFPRDVYYFDKIPTFIQPVSLVLVNAGALAIAIVSSILPALRAALLHPVQALRYE